MITAAVSGLLLPREGGSAMGEKETATTGAAEKAAPGKPTMEQIAEEAESERKGHEASMSAIGNIRA